MSLPTQVTVALLHWGNVWEDFLDPINVSLEEFCREGPSGWMLGYITALEKVKVKTILFLFSRQVDHPIRFTHASTGTTYCILPSPKIYKAVHYRMLKPEGWTVADTFGKTNRLSRLIAPGVSDLAPYLATPITILAQELKREQCSAIICQEYEYARFDVCVLLGKWLHIPVFATFQGGTLQYSRLERWIRPHTMRWCAGLIIPSRIEIDRVQRQYNLPQGKIAQIFNPLDLSLWQSGSKAARSIIRTQIREKLNIPLDAQIVVYHGRIEMYRKGLDVLIDAWTKLCQKHPEENWWLLLVGTGGDANQMKDRIASLPKQNVRWIDEYVTDRTAISHYLCAADLYILTSRHEGFPVAPLEAMASGLPILATEVSGISDILEDHEDSGGIRVPIEDSTKLAYALEYLLADNKILKYLGLKARQRVETKFSLRTVGQQLRDFIIPGSN